MKYQWNQPDSLVEEVRFTPAKKGRAAEAVIVLRPQEDIKTTTLDTALVDQGFSLSYDLIDGQSVLRIGNFKHEKEVLATLQKTEAVKGESQKSASGQEIEPTMLQKVRANSLVLSAVFYQLGNVATALSGWFRRDNDELRSGLAFSVGDTAMLMFGKRSDKEKHDAVMQGFGDSLKQNGIAPSFGSAFTTGLHSSKGGWQGVRNFMHNKVIAIKSASEVTAGISLAIAGQKQSNPYKKAAGILVSSGFALGASIPEKSSSEIREDLGVTTPAEAKEALANLSLWKRLSYKVQQMPLLISGFFAGLNNVSSIIGAFDERKHRWQKHSIANKIGNKTDGLNGEPKKMNETITSDAGQVNKLKNINETAYSKVNRLSQQLDTATAPSKAVGLSEELREAQHELTKLKGEQDSVLKGRYDNKSAASKFWIFNLAQGLLFLVANTLYGISSKSGRSNSEELLGKQFISAVASEVLITPPQDRAEIINIASHYAGSLDELDFTSAEIRTMLEAKLTELESHALFALKEGETEVTSKDNKPLEVIIKVQPDTQKDAEVLVSADHQTDQNAAPKASAAPTETARPKEAKVAKRFLDNLPAGKDGKIKPEDFLANDEVTPKGATIH
ncbi:MAG: hypothetical protein P8P30_06920 [Rickettsiales bacterium]|nr:hypothetical protein [Rickettsiales bacterium]